MNRFIEYDGIPRFIRNRVHGRFGTIVWKTLSPSISVEPIFRRFFSRHVLDVDSFRARLAAGFSLLVVSDSDRGGEGFCDVLPRPIGGLPATKDAVAATNPIGTNPARLSGANYFFERAEITNGLDGRGAHPPLVCRGKTEGEKKKEEKIASSTFAAGVRGTTR